MFVRLQRRRYHARPSSVPLARNNEQQPNGKRERERERQKKYENSYLFFFLKEKKDNQPTSTATNFRRRRRRKDGAAQKPPTHPLPGGWVGGVWLSWQPPPTPSPSSARHHVADTWWSPPTDLSPCRCRLVAQRGPLFTDLWNNRYYSFVFLFTVHTHTHTHTHTRSNNATPLKKKEIYNFKVVLLGLGHSTALLYFLLRFRNGRCPFRSTRDAEPKFRKKNHRNSVSAVVFLALATATAKKTKQQSLLVFFYLVSFVVVVVVVVFFLLFGVDLANHRRIVLEVRPGSSRIHFWSTHPGRSQVRTRRHQAASSKRPLHTRKKKEKNSNNFHPKTTRSFPYFANSNRYNDENIEWDSVEQ